jgi:hypothetical protein
MHNKQKFGKLRLNKKTIVLLRNAANNLQTGKNNSFLPVDDSYKASCTSPGCSGVPRPTTTKPTDTTILFCETF